MAIFRVLLPKSQGASFHRCHIVPETLSARLIRFQARLRENLRRGAGLPMTTSPLAIGISVFRLIGRSFLQNRAAHPAAPGSGWQRHRLGFCSGGAQRINPDTECAAERDAAREEITASHQRSVRKAAAGARVVCR
jgi:hypothetical protein